MTETLERVADLEREMAELREMVNTLRAEVNFLKNPAIGSFFGAVPAPSPTSTDVTDKQYHTVFGKNETREEA